MCEKETRTKLGLHTEGFMSKYFRVQRVDKSDGVIYAISEVHKYSFTRGLIYLDLENP